MTNRLLERFGPEDLRRLEPHFERVSYKHAESLIAPNEPIRHVYKRGSVRILDRDKLEQTSCECYRMVKNEYERLLS